jgi:hypothetical protein
LRGVAFGVYIARPAAVAVPGVVVLQELFGVNADAREQSNRSRRCGIGFTGLRQLNGGNCDLAFGVSTAIPTFPN